MSEELQQAVVDETKAPAEPGVEVENARETTDDLDTLLKQFEQTEAKPPETPKPEHAGAANDPKTAPVDIRAHVRAELQAEKDAAKVIGAIRGDLDPEVFDDKFIDAYLRTEVDQDPRLVHVWNERQRNPRQFQKVVDQLARNFQKRFSKLPDRQATEDREAVTAAVRGASTKAPEGKAPDYSNMSNAEFREAHKKEYGYYPPV